MCFIMYLKNYTYILPFRRDYGTGPSLAGSQNAVKERKFLGLCCEWCPGLVATN